MNEIIARGGGGKRAGGKYCSNDELTDRVRICKLHENDTEKDRTLVRKTESWSTCQTLAQ
jgi:hypothetical protein